MSFNHPRLQFAFFLLKYDANSMTGCDPTKDEWNELSATMLAKKHVVFFDSAYQVIYEYVTF